jgi:TetR/AcrR family transcriptional regulator
MGTSTAIRKKNGKADIRHENENSILEAAETVFAEYGFKGATTSLIAERAKIPKANLHYYFPTKEELYRKVVDNIFNIWLDAANSFDDCNDPAEALTRYISKKMDISRDHPMGSKVWANEILHKAPVIHDYLETTLRDWTDTRTAIIQRWIDEGKIAVINPEYLLYMIWATTQHYADYNHQIETLNGGESLSDLQFEEAKEQVVRIILTGIGINNSTPS